MICDLCHREFDKKQGHAACSSCGFIKGCEGFRCPYCYYEMVPQPKWMTKFFGLFKTPVKKPVPVEKQILTPDQKGTLLTLLEIGTKVEVSHFKTKNHHDLKKMIAMGVFPGTEITLIQKFPSFVFQIGFSQFSVDRELASCIQVKSPQI